MKEYKTAPNSSNKMSEDPLLKKNLRRITAEGPVQVVIETGTYDGTGSTRMLAEAFEGISPPKAFYTCELSFSRYKKAVKNLAKFPFVQPLWGRTVKLDEALEFLKNDEALCHPEKNPDVYVDNHGDSMGFYVKECKRGFTSDKKVFFQKFDPRYYWMKLTRYQGEDLLRKLLQRHKNDRPLILLDSAGGIGYLEFSIVEEIMGRRDYWLILDDIHHIKHYRSIQKVQADPSYEILASDRSKGWALARHFQKDNL